jgi:hypothetical protein
MGASLDFDLKLYGPELGGNQIGVDRDLVASMKRRVEDHAVDHIGRTIPYDGPTHLYLL